LPDRELSTASGAAGDEDNEKMVKKDLPRAEEAKNHS